MSNREAGAGDIEGDLSTITVNGVLLAPKERRWVWTPWPVLNATKLCFSLLIQIAPLLFWVAGALLHVAKPTFQVLIFVGIGYCCAYMLLRRLTVTLSKASALESQSVDWFIDAAGVRRVSSLFDFYIKREGFVAFKEDSKRFLFFTSSQNCMVLPKRCLSTDQAASLRALIANWRS